MELRQSFLLELRDQHICGTQTILPIGITGSIQWSFLSELRDLGLYGVTNDPSFRNYGINTYVELRQSFLLELRDQHIYGTQTILPIGITGSSQWSFLSELRDLGLYRVTNDPSFRNYGINTCSRVPKSPDPFWTEVQGWYNPTTFTETEIYG